MTAGSQLELLKYVDQFFELYFAGGLLQPGGGYLDKLGHGRRSKVSVFTCRGVGLAAGFPGESHEVDSDDEGTDGAAAAPASGRATPTPGGNGPEEPSLAPVNESWKREVKDLTEVLKRLIQRYRYLAKPLDEQGMPGLLTYLPRWDACNQEKMAYATAFLLIDGQITGKCFQSLYRENVIKDDVALEFLTNFFKAYLANSTMDQLATTMRKAGVNDLLAFFPNQVRDRAHLEAHLKKHNLPQVLDYFLKKLSDALKAETTGRLNEMLAPDSSDTIEDIVDFLKQQQTERKVSESDLINWTWTSIMEQVDWTAKPELLESLALKQIQQYAPLLEPFCEGAKTQVSLINSVQNYCYTDTRIIKAFPQILKVLYNADCLSDQAIIYWAAKGAAPQGKQHFLKATEPLVKYLEAQAEEEEDESEEE